MYRKNHEDLQQAKGSRGLLQIEDIPENFYGQKAYYRPTIYLQKAYYTIRKGILKRYMKRNPRYLIAKLPLGIIFLIWSLWKKAHIQREEDFSVFDEKKIFLCCLKKYHITNIFEKQFSDLQLEDDDLFFYEKDILVSNKNNIRTSK